MPEDPIFVAGRITESDTARAVKAALQERTVYGVEVFEALEDTVILTTGRHRVTLTVDDDDSGRIVAKVEAR
jgi:hypothetical protein